MRQLGLRKGPSGQFNTEVKPQERLIGHLPINHSVLPAHRRQAHHDERRSGSVYLNSFGDVFPLLSPFIG